MEPNKVKPVRPNSTNVIKKPTRNNINAPVNNTGALINNERKHDEQELIHNKKVNKANRQIPTRTLLSDDTFDNDTEYQNSSNNFNNNKQFILNDDYELDNNDQNSFTIVNAKKQIPWYIIVPGIAFAILLILGVKIIGAVSRNPKPEFSLINTTAITSETFEKESTNHSLEVEERDLGSGIQSICAHTPNFEYEVQFIQFEDEKQSKAYYNFIVESADEVESSYSKQIKASNSAERVLVSNEYNALIDISYINNTLMIGLAYNTNEFENMANYMNNLGY